MASNEGREILTTTNPTTNNEINLSTPNPIRRMIQSIQRTNRNYPQSMKYINSTYDSKDKLLTVSFQFKRTGFIPSEALDQTKYFDLIGIQCSKPYSESTQIQLVYFYKEGN